ncbi:hypothetical protein J6590_075667 [Homalodisca vitripennis]|nr:hypothetical protein J6590_075667 [Homalodisca vitripennis]
MASDIMVEKERDWGPGPGPSAGTPAKTERRHRTSFICVTSAACVRIRHVRRRVRAPKAAARYFCPGRLIEASNLGMDIRRYEVDTPDKIILKPCRLGFCQMRATN